MYGCSKNRRTYFSQETDCVATVYYDTLSDGIHANYLFNIGREKSIKRLMTIAPNGTFLPTIQ